MASSEYAEAQFKGAASEDEKYRCFINRYLTLEALWAVLDGGR
jgi:hypothetical protein